tara:strand:- start:1071 stop:1730 length:660 start_codon:yes stop_codon:yes gene_type:complete
MSNCILIVAPHADDEILGTGGTIQKHIEAGDTVSIVIVCDRSYNDSSVLMSERAEACRAINHLGVNTSNVYFIGMKDEHLDSNSRDIIKNIEHIYNEIRPHTVYYCHSADINTDHHAVNRACGVITRQLQHNSPDKVLIYEVPSSTTQSQDKTFKPNFYSILTQQQVDRKISALLEYKSEVREFPNPRSAQGIETYSMFRGMECNSSLAEAFQLVIHKE